MYNAPLINSSPLNDIDGPALPQDVPSSARPSNKYAHDKAENIAKGNCNAKQRMGPKNLYSTTYNEIIIRQL